MNVKMRALALTVLLHAGVAAVAVAQEPRVVAPGNVVRFELPDGPVEGRIMSIDAGTVYIRKTMDAPPTEVNRQGIDKVQLRIMAPGRGRRTLVGSLIGGALGAGFGVWLSNNVPCADCVITTQDKVLGTLLFTGIGGVTGASVAWLSARPAWIPARLP
jgi:hypothetical protein